jgi:hypothetical protein
MITATDWLDKVNTRLMWINVAATGEEVTPWFSGETKPSRNGWYERFFTDGIYRHYWDGYTWSRFIAGDAHWRQVGDYPCWRGLVKESKPTLLHTLMVYADDYKESISAGMRKETRAELENALRKAIAGEFKN